MRICFDLPESLPHISHLRKTSRCLVESLGLCREDIDDLEVLLGELSTNVLRHARVDGTEYHVSVELWEDHYIVTVIDRGIGFPQEPTLLPVTLRPDTLSATSEGRIGGMGLVLIRAIGDQVDIEPTEPQGTTVRVQKAIRPVEKL